MHQGSASQPEPTQLLTALPAALAAAADSEVLRVAATAVANLYPGLGYVRVLLVSQNYSPSQLLELCADDRMAAAMAGASNPLSTAASEAHSSSQQAAMRQGRAVYTPALQHQQQQQQEQDEDGDAQQGSTTDFADWRVLQQQFGMCSFAAVPLMVAGTVHGLILAASAAPDTFTPSSMHLLRTAANMLAPYAAVLYKHQQVQSTRAMLEQLLPARVVGAAIDRLSTGGNSAAAVFAPTHHDVQPAV